MLERCPFSYPTRALRARTEATVAWSLASSSEISRNPLRVSPFCLKTSSGFPAGAAAAGAGVAAGAALSDAASPPTTSHPASADTIHLDPREMLLNIEGSPEVIRPSAAQAE